MKRILGSLFLSGMLVSGTVGCTDSKTDTARVQSELDRTKLELRKANDQLANANATRTLLQKQLEQQTTLLKKVPTSSQPAAVPKKVIASGNKSQPFEKTVQPNTKTDETDVRSVAERIAATSTDEQLEAQIKAWKVEADAQLNAQAQARSDLAAAQIKAQANPTDPAAAAALKDAADKNEKFLNTQMFAAGVFGALKLKQQQKAQQKPEASAASPRSSVVAADQ